MKNATVLVLLGKSSLPAEMETLTTTARDHKLHLSLLVLGEAPQLPTFAYGVGPYGGVVIPDGWQKELERKNAELVATCKKIEVFFANQGVSASASALCAEPPALSEAVARLALTCDFVVIADALRTSSMTFRSAIQAALFRSPAGLILNGLLNPKALPPERVLIAWNSGLPAARAIHAALPILEAAKEVVVAIIDPVTTAFRDGEDPGADVALWLSHHGCKLSVQQMPSGGQQIDAALLRKGKEVEQAEFPVFLAH